jgi:NAD(P)-dependent dehydrogenase (short-subunit alcohol dehydrogenase family)
MGLTEGPTTDLEGRTAIVTGAGGGNGAAIAAALCRTGVRVVCADIDGESAERTVHHLRSQGSEAVGVAADHTLGDDCLRTVEIALTKFGSLDVLVNNAGIAMTGTAMRVTEADLQRQLRINVVGPLLMSQAALAPMMEQHFGSIVMIASIAGLAARSGQAPYVISKHALIGLMRSLAVDYAPYGIRVNAVCPELIRTAMTEAYIAGVARRGATSLDETVGELGAVFPLGRLGDPADVAAATLHLASDASAWVTGQAYVLDGGLSLVRPQPEFRQRH